MNYQSQKCQLIQAIQNGKKLLAMRHLQSAIISTEID